MLSELIGPHELKIIVEDLDSERVSLLVKAMKSDITAYKISRRAKKYRRMAEELGSKMCECWLEINALEAEDTPKVTYG